MIISGRTRESTVEFLYDTSRKVSTRRVFYRRCGLYFQFFTGYRIRNHFCGQQREYVKFVNSRPKCKQARVTITRLEIQHIATTLKQSTPSDRSNQTLHFLRLTIPPPSLASSLLVSTSSSSPSNGPPTLSLCTALVLPLFVFPKAPYHSPS